MYGQRKEMSLMLSTISSFVAVVTLILSALIASWLLAAWLPGRSTTRGRIFLLAALIALAVLFTSELGLLALEGSLVKKLSTTPDIMLGFLDYGFSIASVLPCPPYRLWLARLRCCIWGARRHEARTGWLMAK